MSDDQYIAIPLPTIRRYPVYLRLLKDWALRGEAWISATTLAGELRLNPIQVRKDMACTGVEGKPKVGFEVDALIAAIEHHLGWDNTTDAVLVGAGNLGSALVGYKGFENYGLRIIAVFDTDPEKVGNMVHGRKIQAMKELKMTVKRLTVNMGVLAVPEQAAQEAAEAMVKAGIRGIWSFAPKNLKLPESVVIQRTDLSTSFAELSSKLKNAMTSRHNEK
jgi:redox-sensing transcriptional repressor